MHLREGIWVKPRHWVDSKSDSTGQAMGRLFDYGEVIAQIVQREKTLPRDDEHPCRVWWLDILYSWLQSTLSDLSHEG